MNMAHDQLWRLAQQLTRRTRDGKVTWTNAGETQFETRLGGGSVSVRSRDDDGQQPFVLDVLNPEGVRVETSETPGLDTEWDRVIEDLWNEARRSAGGASDVINALLKETEDESDLPF
jgi:hypothetical protein